MLYYMKIGILIPTTSNNRDWKNAKDTYLYNLTLSSFINTCCNDHKYIFYIGIDRDDRLFDNNNTKDFFQDYVLNKPDINIKFIYMDNIEKGFLSKMWNNLFKIAYNEQCDYFFQCGDDIQFATKGWITDCINKLNNNANIGVSGPINNNARILTQTFVHRNHMKIFGFYFPEEILNWCIDDWINLVYKGDYFLPATDHYCSNMGGTPRYLINGAHTLDELKSDQTAYNSFIQLRKDTEILAKNHRYDKLIEYLYKDTDAASEAF